MCMSGSPATGRTLIRSLEMSVTLGATTTWTLCCSRSHTTSRIFAPVPIDTAGEEDDVGLGLHDQGRDVVGVAEDRDARGVSSRVSVDGVAAPMMR